MKKYYFMLSKLQHTSRVSKDVFIKSILNTYLLSIFIYYQHYRNNIYVFIYSFIYIFIYIFLYI